MFQFTRESESEEKNYPVHGCIGQAVAGMQKNTPEKNGEKEEEKKVDIQVDQSTVTITRSHHWGDFCIFHGALWRERNWNDVSRATYVDVRKMCMQDEKEEKLHLHRENINRKYWDTFENNWCTGPREERAKKESERN